MLTEEDGLIYLGHFAVMDAKRLIEVLDEARVPYQAEPENSGIEQMSAFAASLGGTFGEGAQVVISVSEEDEGTARKIVSLLFPDQI